MLQTGRVIGDFSCHFGKKGIISRIERAGKHRILPDKNAKCVTEIVEIIAFIPAATPDAQHVHIGINSRLQQPAQGRRAGLAGKCILGNPVGAHRENRPVIDTEQETAPDRIRLRDQFQLAQTNAFRDLAPIKVDHEVVQCLWPLIDRPPQIRIGYIKRKTNRLCGAVAGGGYTTDASACRRDIAGLDLLSDGQADLSVMMRLMDEGVPGYQCGIRIQIQIAIDSHRHQGGIPVPAEITLRLAQHITADAGIMFGEGHEVGLACLALRCGADRRMKGNLDLVAARDKPVRQRQTIAAKRILGRGNQSAVHADGCDGIKARHNQIGPGLVRRQGKVPAGRPVAFSHPAHIMFIHAPVGIGNMPCGMQRRNQICGKGNAR